jgi:hypothetical protein
MLALDLQAAGIEPVTDSGVIDFHALRNSYVTHLVASGATVNVCQTLARHSDAKLTIGVYAKASVEAKVAAVNALPDLTPPPAAPGASDPSSNPDFSLNLPYNPVPDCPKSPILPPGGSDLEPAPDSTKTQENTGFAGVSEGVGGDPARTSLRNLEFHGRTCDNSIAPSAARGGPGGLAMTPRQRRLWAVSLFAGALLLGDSAQARYGGSHSPHGHFGAGPGPGFGRRGNWSWGMVGAGGGWASFYFLGLGAGGTMFMAPPLMMPPPMFETGFPLAGPMPPNFPPQAGPGAGDDAPRPAPPAAGKRNDPSRMSQLVTLGDRMFRVGDIHRAAERYEQAARSDPNAALPRIRLAQIELNRSHFGLAANWIREAVTVEPGWLSNAPDIQSLYAEPGDFARQIAKLESHLQAHPGDRDAWLVLGTQWYLSGRTRKAADVFLRLADRKPDPTLNAFLDATAADPTK